MAQILQFFFDRVLENIVVEGNACYQQFFPYTTMLSKALSSTVIKNQVKSIFSGQSYCLVLLKSREYMNMWAVTLI